MPKTPKQDDVEDEDIIVERMNKALKVMMSTPPETHEQMVKRRRKDEPKRSSGKPREGTK